MFDLPWFANDVPTSERLRIICMHLSQDKSPKHRSCTSLIKWGVEGGPADNNPHDPLSFFEVQTKDRGSRDYNSLAVGLCQLRNASHGIAPQVLLLTPAKSWM